MSILRIQDVQIFSSALLLWIYHISVCKLNCCCTIRSGSLFAVVHVLLSILHIQSVRISSSALLLWIYISVCKLNCCCTIRSGSLFVVVHVLLSILHIQDVHILSSAWALWFWRLSVWQIKLLLHHTCRFSVCRLTCLNEHSEYRVFIFYHRRERYGFDVFPCDKLSCCCTIRIPSLLGVVYVFWEFRIYTMFTFYQRCERYGFNAFPCDKWRCCCTIRTACLFVVVHVFHSIQHIQGVQIFSARVSWN
jgi:hypothetical protein